MKETAMFYKRLVGSLLVVGACGAQQAAQADDIEDFYKGRTVTVVVQAGPGGAYGLNARVLANHMGKHIPGNPNIVLQHMPGAGGVKASNYMYNVAAKDGATWSFLGADIAVVQRLRPKGVRYDAAKFGWIGSLGPYDTVLSVYESAGVNTMDDLKSKKIILGHTGRSNQNYVQALMLEDLLKLKIENVAGYRGGSDLYLAMEQGEIHGRIGSWASLKTTKADWLAAKKMKILLVMGPKRVTDLPDVPTVLEVAKDEGARQAFGFFSGATEVGWSVSTTPSVPAARLAALRKAFDATAKDAAFQKEMKARKLDLEPSSGKELEAAVKKTLATPPAVIKQITSKYMAR